MAGLARAACAVSIIRTEGLTRYFGGLAAVKDVSLAVEPGELRAIIGPNGAGKTSLFNLLTGRFAPTSGSVYLKDREVTGWPPHAIARAGLARTFQITNIFPKLTARENVRVAAQLRERGIRTLLCHRESLRHTADTTDRVLETVGLSERADCTAAELAYGDQRLLEIGIALATEPSILLLDEPMAGMSPAETARTADLIRSLAGKLTVLLIEHDMDVVLGISEVVTVMHHGSVLAEGSSAEIQASSEVQAAYLGAV
jgi:branched-chain amino acid transport system ATP-binding protein